MAAVYLHKIFDYLTMAIMHLHKKFRSFVDGDFCADFKQNENPGGRGSHEGMGGNPPSTPGPLQTFSRQGVFKRVKHSLKIPAVRQAGGHTAGVTPLTAPAWAAKNALKKTEEKNTAASELGW